MSLCSCSAQHEWSVHISKNFEYNLKHNFITSSLDKCTANAGNNAVIDIWYPFSVRECITATFLDMKLQFYFNSRSASTGHSRLKTVEKENNRHSGLHKNKEVSISIIFTDNLYQCSRVRFLFAIAQIQSARQIKCQDNTSPCQSAMLLPPAKLTTQKTEKKKGWEKRCPKRHTDGM